MNEKLVPKTRRYNFPINDWQVELILHRTKSDSMTEAITKLMNRPIEDFLEEHSHIPKDAMGGLIPHTTVKYKDSPLSIL